MPLSVDQALRKASSFAQKGDIVRAEKIYTAILEKFPRNARAIQGLSQLKRAKQAPQTHHKLPAHQIDLLTSLYQQRKYREVLSRASELTKQYQNEFGLFNMLGAASHAIGLREEAIENYRKAVSIKPDYATGHNNLGVIYKDLGRFEDAIASLKTALRINPGYADSYYNLGIAFKDLGRHREAIESFKKALQINPDHAEAHNNLGSVFKYLNRHEAAKECLEKALRLKPENAEIHYNLANALQVLGQHKEAIGNYNKALEINPGLVSALAQKLYEEATICDWSELEDLKQALSELGISTAAVPPFTLLSFEDAPEHHLKRAKNYAREKYSGWALPEIGRCQITPGRLRIGYFSADFHNHATMHLMARLFELHDKDRFSIHAYSYGPDRDDEMRERLIHAVDVFHDVRTLDDKEIAQLARKEGINIAVDLKGYTTDTRSGIFAYRAAPIQVNYLGYPGSMGAPFIDYIIADPTVIPEESGKFYSEKIIYLPHTYQVNDNTKEISEKAFAREELGLPEDGFVFCCFNNNYKIGPGEFAIWTRLLQKVEGSVLWLLKSNEWAEQNLKSEVQKRGVDPGRLVFAGRMGLAEHLARHRLADLFLDTFTYNAHTTASDALWAGLPVLTKAGRGFPARVAASLLTAIDLPELVTTTKEDYENLALELATNPQRLRGIKAKLAANRSTKPLFNSELFTEHLEQAYQNIHARYADKLQPATVRIKG